MKMPTKTNVICSLACGLALSVASANSAQAQAAAQPYAGQQSRPIKSLSESDVSSLLTGQGAGLAKAAELNGYPGPAHTLELQVPLRLSAEQVTASTALMAEHKSRAMQIGAEVVAAERRLDALFADRRADAAAVENVTREVAVLQARLRAEHLNTHLLQTALLSAKQVEQYSLLRGYSGAATSASPTAAPTSGHRHH